MIPGNRPGSVPAGSCSTKPQAATARADERQDEADRASGRVRGHRAGGYHRRGSGAARRAGLGGALAVPGAPFRVAQTRDMVSGASTGGGATAGCGRRRRVPPGQRAAGATVGSAQAPGARLGRSAGRPLGRRTGGRGERGRPQPPTSPAAAASPPAHARPNSARSRAAACPRRSRSAGRRPTSTPDPGDPATRRRQLPPPDRDPPQGDVERPEQQRQDEQQRPQSVNRSVAVRSWRHGSSGVAMARPAGRGAQRAPGTARWRRAAGTRRRSGRPARPSARAATTPAASG